MKKILLLLFLAFPNSLVFAENWCQNANTELCLTAEEGITTIDDRSSNNFSITKGAGVDQSSAQNPDTWSSYSYSFSGSATPISFDEANILDFESNTEDFSVCVWVRSDNISVSPASCLFVLGDANDDFWRLIFFGTGQVWASLDAIDVKSDLGVISNNTWAHVCTTLDRDGNGQIWINGAASGSAVELSSETLSLTTTTFYIGQNSDSAQRFDGYADEHLIYSSLLDSTDINNIMDYGLIGATRRFILLN